MKGKNLKNYVFVLVILMPATNAFGENDWQKIQTVEEVYQEYPERMNALLKSLNLELDGLKHIKEAFQNGNTVLACTYLLAYYKKGATAEFLRQELPAISKDINPGADSIAQNIFTFYQQPAKVPRNSNGHLDWTYRGPAKDIEWTWALNRHYHLKTLLEAYFYTGNPQYVETIDLHVKDWVISSLPYPGKKSSTAMWRGLEVSFRVKIWAHIFYGLINSEYLTPATRLLLISSILEHAHYLRHFHAEGNWLTMEISALAMIATAWPEFKNSSSWITYARETMMKSLKKQVYPDGVQTELSSSYHQVALNNFNQFREIFQQGEEPLPEPYNKQLEKMWNYLAYTMRPDGYGLLNNDSDRNYNRKDIIQAALQYNREDWQFIATNGKEGRMPQDVPSILFPWAGHLIMRSGYEADAQWAFFDIGPWGTGHQHNDKLHLSISAYGRDLLVDGGRFAYRGKLADKFRNYARSSYSHNVILIDGEGQSAGPKSTSKPLTGEHWKSTEDFDYAWSSFEKFNDLKGEASHIRTLFYVRGKFWVVVDYITTDRPRKIETLWHWHPDNNVKIENNNSLTSNSKGNLKIMPVGFTDWDIQQINGQEKPHPQGWYSEKYNKAEPSPVSIYSTEIKINTSFVWILYPSEGAVPQIKAKVLSQQKEGLEVQVTHAAEGEWNITIPFSNSSNAAFNYSSFSGSIK